MTQAISLSVSVVMLFLLLVVLLMQWWTSQKRSQLDQEINYLSKKLEDMQQTSGQVNQILMQSQQDQLKQSHEQNINNVKLLQENLTHLQQQLLTLLGERIAAQNEQIGQLHQVVERRLQHITSQVEERLQQGFEKTTATFSDVIKRLALIDEAQKRITELSQNVINLKEILSDKRSRGAFGEVQLEQLVRNLIPEPHFSMQHLLSNGKRCDCMLFLPEPTGSIAIDSKFPLESYQRFVNPDAPELERREAEKQFRIDVKKHIKDIATKYILPGETNDGALMFIPAEAIFAEIHAHYPDLVEEAQRSRVWLTSPTTLMAVLTTAKAVLKDAATKQQVHLIQQHLQELAKDFKRFEDRMSNLGRHIEQAHKDVQEVQTSATKISSRFAKIDKVDLDRIEGV